MRIREILYETTQYYDEMLKKNFKKKLADLNEDDAHFVYELVYQRLFLEITGLYKTISNERGRLEEILKSLPYLHANGRIRKLDLGEWFTYLLPFWIKRIVDSKRIHGFSKNEIAKSINGFVSHKVIIPDEIDPCGNLLDDLPDWYFNIIPESIGLLSKLKYLDLGGNHIIKVPVSIKNLKNLRELHLGFNMLESLPDWLADLPKLRRLSVRHNPLKTVPKCVIKVAEKNYSHFHKDIPRKEAIVLGILEILSGHILYKIEDKRRLNGDYEHSYIVNKEGHVSHIFMWQEDISFEFFPEQLCDLTYLEELHILPNAITSLPESLSKLNMLKVLDLSNFFEDVGRSEEPSIPESIFLFLKNLKRFSFVYDDDLYKKLGR